VHAVNEAFEAEDEDVAVFGVHFDTGNHEEIVALREFGNLVVLPEEVVLGEADTI
jgi:hypothetical protein